jgi:uncharacterized membrane protein (DUF4010 family)
MVFASFISILFFWFKEDKNAEKIERGMLKVKSPFNAWSAIKFGAFFAFVIFLVKVGSATMGHSGIYIISLVSGIMDVDPIAIEMSNEAHNGLAPFSAVTAITFAAMMNTLVKGGIFMFLGNRRVAVRILLAFLFVIFSGGISLLFIY